MKNKKGSEVLNGDLWNLAAVRKKQDHPSPPIFV